MTKKTLILALSAILILLGNVTLVGQQRATQGSDFWLTFMSNYGVNEQVMNVIISAEKACSGTIENPNASWSQDFTIGDNQALTIQIPIDECYIGYSSAGLITGKGIHITSSDDISVYTVNYEKDSYDGSNVIPTEKLGSDYIIQTYAGNGSGSEFCIVATEDNTTVDITPSAKTTKNQPAYSTFTISLNKGQTYLVHTFEGTGDFSGSTVSARNGGKIVVFAGNRAINVPSGYGWSDHIYEQMPPLEYCARRFALARTKNSYADRIRVTAVENSTHLTLNGETLATIDAKQTYEFELTANSAYLESDKPVLTASYMTSSKYPNYENGNQDPSMIMIDPLEQKIRKVVFGTFQKDNKLTSFVNICTNTADVSKLTFDGNDISENFSVLDGNNAVSYARMQISDGTHVLESSDGLGFTAFVYGTGADQSYAYSVGSRIRDINEVDTIVIFKTICQGETYTDDFGFNITPTEPGLVTHETTYVDEYNLVNFIRLNLTVNPAPRTTFYDTICYGNSYYEHGFEIDNPGLGMNYDTLFLATTLDCDSTIYLELFVAPVYDSTFYDTICYGNGYHQHGFELDSLELEVGMNYDTLFLATTLGCDSIVKLELYVAPVYDSTFYDTICYGNGYHQHGFEIESLELEVGMNYDTLFLKTIYDCDSTVYLELLVAPIYDSTFYDTICYGNGYHQHGFEIDNPGLGMNYDTLFLATTLGCDSIVKLELYVAPVYDSTFYDTICYGNGYHQHGFEIDSLELEVGMNYDTLFLATTLGCDSIVKLELYVAPVYDSTFYDTICYGNGYHEHGFEIDSLSLEVGMNYDTLFLATTLGCDSIVKLELFVAPVYDSTFNEHICFGNPYQEHGFDLDSLSVGWHFDTLFLATTLGCDSIVKLELYVAPLHDTTFIDTTCINLGYHKHGFELDSLDLGMYYDTLFLASIYGCDSTVYLELYVAPIFDTTFYDTICFGNGYHEHGFELDNPEVGMNFDTLFLQTVLGCDSTVYLELYVAPIYNIELYDSICFGEDYHKYGFDFEQPEPGIHDDKHFLTTVLGCDSIVSMILFVGEVYDIDIKDTICYGEDYDRYNFHLVNPAVGTHFEMKELTSIYGCDSVVRLNLNVAPVYEFTVSDSICEGEHYTNYGVFMQKPAPGIYHKTGYLKTELGCDSIFHVTIKVINTFQEPDTLYGMREVFASTGLLSGIYHYSIDTIPGCKEYIWELDNEDWGLSSDMNICTITAATAGVGTLTVWAGNSCGTVWKSVEITAGYFGVDENENVNVNVYPNPSNGYVNVESNGVEVINILSATGVVVKRFKYEDEDNVTVDIADLPNSIYVLEIVTRDGKCIRRVTKTSY